MPIYEYACRACGHQFEALVRSSTVPECPNCHAKTLDKQLSVFATTASTAAMAPMPPSPCNACPGSGGQGACAFSSQNN